MRLSRQAISVLLVGLFATCLSPAKKIRLEWDHNGTCTDKRTKCPVSHYNVYMSLKGHFTDPKTEKLIGSTPRGHPEITHFETDVPDDKVTRYFAVTAVGSDGQQSGFSSVVTINSAKGKVAAQRPVVRAGQ